MAPAKKASAKKTAAKKAPAKKTAAKKAAAPKKQPSVAISEPGDENSMLMQLFTDQLKDIYWAEKHLVKTLPKMKKAATSEELAAAFEDHLQVTMEQVARVEEVFEMLGKKPQAKKCEAMAGLTEEGQSIIEETDKGTSTRDAGLIIAAQKIEHYEIASYGGLAQLATTMGLDDVAELLRTTLEEEKETDVLLTQIAEGSVNEEASDEDEEEGGDEEE